MTWKFFLAKSLQAWRFLLGFSLLTGLIYPLVLTGLAQVIFPWRAQGSMQDLHGTMVGSQWIGQSFTTDEYFWGRPSATAGVAYNGLASGGSNLGPSNPLFRTTVQERILQLKLTVKPIPVELVTASGSGLDPDISPIAAYYQAQRVAAARQLTIDQVTALIQQYIIPRTLGVLGEPRINVLALNLALDNLQGANHVAAAVESR